MSTKRVKGRHEDSSTCYMVNFTTTDEVFRLPRKEAKRKERLHHYPQRTRWRYIVDVRRVPSVPVRCVQVDNADQMYLAAGHGPHANRRWLWILPGQRLLGMLYRR